MFSAPSGPAFNAGCAQSVSIEEWADIVRSAPGVSTEAIIARTALAGWPVDQYVACDQKAEPQPGWRCEVPLEEANGRTARSYAWG